MSNALRLLRANFAWLSIGVVIAAVATAYHIWQLSDWANASGIGIPLRISFIGIAAASIYMTQNEAASVVGLKIGEKLIAVAIANGIALGICMATAAISLNFIPLAPIFSPTKIVLLPVFFWLPFGFVTFVGIWVHRKRS